MVLSLRGGEKAEKRKKSAPPPTTTTTTPTIAMSPYSSSSSPPPDSSSSASIHGRSAAPANEYPSPSSRDVFGSGSSLAQYYVPDKIAASPSHWGSEARRASRMATGGWGAAASTSRRSSGSKSDAGTSLLPALPMTSSTMASGRSSPVSHRASGGGAAAGGVLFRPLYRDSGDSTSTFASSIYSPYNGRPHDSSYASSSVFAQRPSAAAAATSGHRNRKVPAGRDAWGQNGGGSPALGAGEYEDDDGVELSTERLVGRAPSSSGGGGGGIETPPLSAAASTLPGSNGHDRSTTRLLSSVGSSNHIPGIPIAAKKRRFRWNRFKWTMVAANAVLTLYSVIGFVVVTVALSGMYKETSILDAVNRVEMLLCMVAMALCLCTVLVGWAGLLLNNRAFLSVYTLLLWISFIFIVAPGYIAYKKRTFNLNGKMNQTWSRQLDIVGRRNVQRVLNCCGYYSPFVEAAADSNRCFARSMLPGCKGVLIHFERRALQYIYICSFSIVPVHLLIIVTSLLCSDHITYRFGKGVTPKEYRVDDVIFQQHQALATRPQSPQTIGTTNGQSTVLLSVPRPPFWGKDGKRGASSSTTTTTSSNF